MHDRLLVPAVGAVLFLGTGCASLSPSSATAPMIHEAIENPEMPRPLGPYSHAIRASGDLLFVAGQPGLDPDTGELPESFVLQARQAFENLDRVLRASGSGMEHVVKTTVFMVDVDRFQEMNELYREFFPTRAPARSTPIVQLPRGVMISIEAIALVAPLR